MEDKQKHKMVEPLKSPNDGKDADEVYKILGLKKRKSLQKKICKYHTK